VIITHDDRILLSSGLAGRLVPTPLGNPSPQTPDQG